MAEETPETVKFFFAAMKFLQKLVLIVVHRLRSKKSFYTVFKVAKIVSTAVGVFFDCSELHKRLNCVKVSF